MTSLSGLGKNLAYQHNKKTGATYVYEVHSYWDKEKKAPRNKQVYLGKLDSSTGEIIPSERKKPRKAQFEHAITGSATARVIGPYMILEKIAKDTGVAGILKKCFPDLYEQILSMAYFITQKGLPLSRSESWSTTNMHPFKVPIASQRISELLHQMTEDDREQFMALWLKKVAENDFLCYDITSISSYSECNEYVRYGYNRDGEKLPQINMAMIIGQNSQLPAYYRRLPGNITDVTTLSTTLASLNFLGATHMHFVLDRGFYSQSNIDELFQGRHQFTAAIPAGRKWVEDIIDKHYDSAVSPINYHEIEGQKGLYTSTVLHKWGETGRRCYLHIYYNASRAGEEYEKFTRHLLEAKRKLEIGELSEADKKRYLRYFIVKETPKRGRSVKLNDAEIQKYRKRYAGFFCILSNKIKTAVEALHIYRTKEVVENCFDDLKNQLDMKRLRVHDSNAMDARMFLQFLALIFICRMRNIIRKDKDLKNLTVREVMEMMETLVQIKYVGRYGQLYTEIGPKERKIMIAFDVPVPT